MKVLANIKFNKSCKTENVKVRFLTVKLLQKNRNYKLKLQIEQLVMETEIQIKHLKRESQRKILNILESNFIIPLV